MSTQPIGRRVEQRVRDLLIVDRFEHPEAADIRLVERVVIRIVARHDPPDDFPAGARQKKRGIAVLDKTDVSRRLRNSFRSIRSGGTQAGSFCIDPPGKFDEGVAFRARTTWVISILGTEC